MRWTRHGRCRAWMRWVARIWSLPLLGYALLLAVGYVWSWITTGTADPYTENVSPLEALPPILMFLSVLGLGVAWRWERLGGAVTVLLQAVTLPVLMVCTPVTRDFPRTAIPYLLSAVVVIPGALFLLCSKR